MTSTKYDSDAPMSPVIPAVEALRTRHGYTRAQLAWFMKQAMRWGYDLGYEDGQRDELALASVSAAYAYTGSFSAEATWREVAKVERCREADAAACLPRLGDHPGGPAEMWGDDEPGQQVAA